MSYSRAHGTGLRVFIDAMNWLFSRGVARTEWVDHNTGSWSYNSAAKDNKYTLIDMNPLKKASFNTSASQQGHIMHGMDFQVTSNMPLNFLAIMNHNAYEAEACFRLAYDSVGVNVPGAGTTIGSAASPPVTVLNGTLNPASGATLAEGVDFSETEIDVSDGTKFTVGEYILITYIAAKEVMKVLSIAANTLTVLRGQQGTGSTAFPSGTGILRYNVVYPAENGDTIIIFDEVDNARYWGIEVIPSDGAYHFIADLTIGAYLIGKYHDFTIAPDLSVNHGFIQEGVKTRKTPAGRQLTFAHNLSNNDSTDEYSPFRSNDDYFRRMIGKEFWNLTWKGDEDTNIYPSDTSTPSSGSLLGDFIHHVSINFLPFIFCSDNDSTLKGDYLWGILDQDSFETMQKAWQWCGFKLKIIQKF